MFYGSMSAIGFIIFISFYVCFMYFIFDVKGYCTIFFYNLRRGLQKED